MKKCVFFLLWTIGLVLIFFTQCNLAISFLDGSNAAPESVQLQESNDPAEGGDSTPTPIPPFSPTPSPDPSLENIFFIEDNFGINPGAKFKIVAAVNTGENLLGTYTVVVSFDESMVMLDPELEDREIVAAIAHSSFKVSARSSSSYQVRGTISGSPGYCDDLTVFAIHFQAKTKPGSTAINLIIDAFADQTSAAIGNQNPPGDSCRLKINWGY